jgi:hypothetical protein
MNALGKLAIVIDSSSRVNYATSVQSRTDVYNSTSEQDNATFESCARTHPGLPMGNHRKI